MGVIKEALTNRLSSECTGIDLMAKGRGKDSTLRDYDQKWKAFTEFLQREKVRTVGYLHLANFLKALYDR